MSNDYQTPIASLIDAHEELRRPYFITSLSKMCILYIFTFGLYSIYWFYKQWQLQRFYAQLRISPALRSIFYVFFTYPLFRRIAEEGEKVGIGRWAYQGQAFLLILFYLVNFVASRLVTYHDVLTPVYLGALSTYMLMLFPLYQAQKQANLVCGDPEGEANSSFSLPNIVFVILGALFWLLIIAGMLLTRSHH